MGSPTKTITCPRCKGKGKVTRSIWLPRIVFSDEKSCPTCNGTGSHSGVDTSGDHSWMCKECDKELRENSEETNNFLEYGRHVNFLYCPSCRVKVRTSGTVCKRGVA